MDNTGYTFTSLLVRRWEGELCVYTQYPKSLFMRATDVKLQKSVDIRKYLAEEQTIQTPNTLTFFIEEKAV